jgi:hypothetical protein
MSHDVECDKGKKGKEKEGRKKEKEKAKGGETLGHEERKL